MTVSHDRLSHLLAAADLDLQESGTTIIRSSTLKDILTELMQLRQQTRPRKSSGKEILQAMAAAKHLPDDLCMRCGRERKKHGTRADTCVSFVEIDVETAAKLAKGEVVLTHKYDKCDAVGCDRTRQEHRLLNIDHEFVEPRFDPRPSGPSNDDICARCKKFRYQHDGRITACRDFEKLEQLDIQTAIEVFGQEQLDRDHQFEVLTRTLRAKDVVWVVNEIAELGVKIGNRFFFLWKGRSLVYNTAEGEADENGMGPMRWREVGKREFGEVVKPTQEHLALEKAWSSDDPGDCRRYVLPLYGADGPLENGGWALMPLQPEED